VSAHVERLAARLVAEEMLGAPAVDLQRGAFPGGRDDGLAQPGQHLLGTHVRPPDRRRREPAGRSVPGRRTDDGRAAARAPLAASERVTIIMVGPIVPEPGEGWQVHPAARAGFHPPEAPRRGPPGRLPGCLDRRLAGSRAPVPVGSLVLYRSFAWTTRSRGD